MSFLQGFFLGGGIHWSKTITVHFNIKYVFVRHHILFKHNFLPKTFKNYDIIPYIIICFNFLKTYYEVYQLLFLEHM